MRPGNFNDLIELARTRPDMMSALSSVGVKLKRIGRSRHGEQYKISTNKGVSGDYSSVVFCWNIDGSWIAIDNKERTGRKTLDSIGVMTDLFGLNFDEAVYALTGTCEVSGRRKIIEPTSTPPLAPEVKREVFVLPERRQKQSWKGLRYLVNDRFIPEPVVKTLFEKGTIYMPYIESKRTKKPIDLVGFIAYDENHNPVSLEADATFIIPGKHRFKMLHEGSDQRYGFMFKNNIDLVQGKPKIYFCESAVDAMSLFTLKNLPGIYVSMTGLKDMMLNHMTNMFDGMPVICTDNDDAGNRFRRKFSTYEILVPEYGKDWNDELRYRVCQGLGYALKNDSTLSQKDIDKYLESQKAFAATFDHTKAITSLPV